jgi:putative ABC transport system permease protein
MGILHDVKYGLRLLLKSPFATLAMLLILGVGIGTNTAIISLVNALYWKPINVAHPEQLVKIFAKGRHAYGAGFSYPEYISFRDHNASFSSLAAESTVAQLHILSQGEALEARGAFVSANYFPTVGVKPSIGRFFLPEEDLVPDRDPVAVISAAMWKNRFGNDPAIVGRRITVNRVELQIVGVAPPGFGGVHAGTPEELWMPSMLLHLHGYGGCAPQVECRVFDDLIGRLAEGRRLADAKDELSRIVVWSATDWSKNYPPRQIAAFRLTGVDPDERPYYAAQMRLLVGVAAVLLLVSCANLTGLLLARSVARGREIAVRLSIGASRARITRQLLTENLLLSFAGCLFGLGFSAWARNALAGFYNVSSEGFPHLYDLRLDWRVLAFAFALSILTCGLFGLAPALQATRLDLITQLKEGSGSVGTPRGGRLRQALVAGQIALSLVLLVAAGLMVRSSQSLERGTNFDPQHVAVLRIRPELLHYSPRQNEQLFRQIVATLRTLPGVEAVTSIHGGQGLIWHWQSGRDVSVNLPGASAEGLEVRHHDIDLDFFQTLRIPLLEGHDFTEQDDAHVPPVAILNATLAKKLWPAASAMGRIVMVNQRATRVVGVVADIQPKNAVIPAAPYLFLPLWQSDPGKEGDLRVAVRVKSDPDAALPAIRRAIHSIDPNIPIGEDMSMAAQIEIQYMPVMLSRTVISYCGVIALCLSAVGLFSALTYYVKTRTREIGIRMALGAQLQSVLELIIGQGLTMSLTGVAVGLLLAVGTTRLLAGWLYGIRLMDYLTFAIASLLLLTVAIAASYLPAQRAAKVDPIVALRQE